MAIDFKYMKENIDDYRIGNIKLKGASMHGIAIELIIGGVEDILDFVEELGIYFYRIDDPKFGQLFLNENVKLSVYDWLVQFLNTGNYEELEDHQIYAEFELYFDFDLLTPNIFSNVLKKYKTKYEKDKKQNIEISKLLAELTAINILEMIVKVRNTEIKK